MTDFLRKTFVLSLLLCPLLFAEDGQGKKKSLTLLGGYPHLANIGLDYRLGSKMSFGIGGGYWERNSTWDAGDTAKVTNTNLEARLRIHIFSGAFFVGAAGGYKSVSGKAVRTVANGNLDVEVEGTGRTKLYYAIPHIGWFKVAKSGFTIGLEAGVFIPFPGSSEVSLTSSDPLIAVVTSTTGYSNFTTDLNTFASEQGSKKLPYFAARLGWSF